MGDFLTRQFEQIATEVSPRPRFHEKARRFHHLGIPHRLGPPHDHGLRDHRFGDQENLATISARVPAGC